LIGLNGFRSSWHNFAQVIYCEEKLHDVKKLWDVFIGEEIRLKQVSTSYKDEDDGPDLALIGKVRRGGRKGGPWRGMLSSLYTPTNMEKSPTHLVCP
jgi:hypothetical protein